MVCNKKVVISLWIQVYLRFILSQQRNKTALMYVKETLVAKCDWCFIVGHAAQSATGVAWKNSWRKLRLVFHRGIWSAKCDWCLTKNHAAQNATAVPRWNSRRKMRNHSANLRSLISVWKLDFSEKKYAAQFAIRLFKNKKSNSGLEIRLFRKKACGAFCD